MRAAIRFIILVLTAGILCSSRAFAPDRSGNSQSMPARDSLAGSFYAIRVFSGNGYVDSSLFVYFPGIGEEGVKQFSSPRYAGEIKFNGVSLNFSTGHNSYSGRSGMFSFKNVTWSCGGSAGIPSFECSVQSQFPTFDGIKEFPEEVAADDSIMLNLEGIQNCNNVYVEMSGKDERFFKHVEAGQKKCSFTKEEVRAVKSDEIQFTLYLHNVVVKCFEGKFFSFSCTTQYYKSARIR